MPVAITAFYTAILALIASALAYQAGSMRPKLGISVGDGGNIELLVKMRRHANFTESVPLALILMGAIEIDGASAGLIHGLGIALVVCRIAHPIGLQHDNISHPARAIGSGGTLVVTLIAAGTAIWQFI